MFARSYIVLSSFVIHNQYLYIECDEGFHGHNCSKRCGQCQGLCDKVTGECENGCLEGYEGNLCTTQGNHVQGVNNHLLSLFVIFKFHYYKIITNYNNIFIKNY